MKILMLVNWKIDYCKETPEDKQAPDYYIDGQPYWFYRYFEGNHEIDVVDIRSNSWLENFEKNKLRFYVWQTLKVLPRLSKYDLVISHGMQSGVVLSLIRRFFKFGIKHIVFDIGSFNSAAEQGMALKLMQIASKSIDGIIYHTSSQKKYYEKYFPWIVEKSKFIEFGADYDYFERTKGQINEEKDSYILAVGYARRDWKTLIEAYQRIETNIKLRIIGHVMDEYSSVSGLEQFAAIPINELNNHINNAKFCVLPLEAFNYSYGQMTLLQQMSMGKCVVASRVPSLIDYMEDGKTAVVYEPKNVEDLVRNMKMLIDDSELCYKIGQNAKRYLKEVYNECDMAKEIEQFYRDISN